MTRQLVVWLFGTHIGTLSRPNLPDRPATSDIPLLIQVAVFDGRDFDMNVNLIQQRAGDAGTVVVDRDGRACAGVGWIRKVAAGTGVC